ncbi:MAG: DNA helicase RecQ [Cyanobacteriota bacterium]|nr:DNA helicase RecQ [Cyanobacteriota bacterium]
MSDQLLTALKHYFGYDQFRSGQQQVMEQALQGRDVFVLMPTGAGKSLCYQLPALLTPGVTLVISPLIALMQDQVMALQNNGIAAAFLNSTLTPDEQRSCEQRLRRGEFRLLYLAPERLAQEDFWSLLTAIQQRQGIPRLVVDEAHCISEWGHDFRPDYRQLSQVRQRLGSLPVTALTATATERVQRDIEQQLELRDPFCWVSSFNRPNLYYGVQDKTPETDIQIIQCIRNLSSGTAIIYAGSRAGVEKLTQKLTAHGIQALPYHAGLTAEERQHNQTQFIRDQAQVMVATLAFGMGINKPDVRLVIHYDLPKNLESYYQESGRAGRDGLEAQCLLFYSHADRNKVEFWIQQKADPQEQRIARQQLCQVIDYATTRLCRRQIILNYFSDQLQEDNCRNCDNCCYPVALEDRTIEAQKFLSCVYRCQERYGMNHIINVLRGSSDERVIKAKHDHLSTYGIGSDLSSVAWKNLGRFLLQQGFLQETNDGYSILTLTEKSWEVLRGIRTLEAPPIQPLHSDKLEKSNKKQQAISIQLSAAQQQLYQHLRTLRRQVADARSIPPYIIFSDRTLLEMAQRQPSHLNEFAQLHGVGDRKLEDYGGMFLKAIDDFLQRPSPAISSQSTGIPKVTILSTPKDGLALPPHPQVSATNGLTASTKRSMDLSVPPGGRDNQDQSTLSSSINSTHPTNSIKLNPTWLETLTLHQQGLSVDAIANKRHLSKDTIYKHLTELLASEAEVNLDDLVSPARQRQIFRVIFQQKSYGSLTALREALGEDYSYEEIRLVRAALFGQP